jgi:hypothetical protein
MIKSLFKALVARLVLFAEFGDQLTVPGFKAAADLTGKQYTAVRHSAALTTNLASDATNSGVLGVLQNKPSTNEAATIAYQGLSKMRAGGAITAGVLITYNSSGKAAAVASGQMAIGRAIEAAGADEEVITVLLLPPVRWAGAI